MFSATASAYPRRWIGALKTEGRARRAERAKRKELIVQWMEDANARDIPLGRCVAKVEVGTPVVP